jgi:hypothetical protein
VELIVQIVSFVSDEPQPGIVACELVDAEGKGHTFIDKVPGFSIETLDSHSTYPRAGAIRCRALDKYLDTNGRDVVRITTDLPDHIESTEGLSDFVVLPSQLASIRTDFGR